MVITFNLHRWRLPEGSNGRRGLHYIEYGQWQALCGEPIDGMTRETHPFKMTQDENPYCSGCSDRHRAMVSAFEGTKMEVVIV